MTIATPPLRILIPALWLAWLILWLVAAFGTKPARWREPIASRVVYTAPLLACALLLAKPGLLPPALKLRFLPIGGAPPIVGAVLVAAGLGLTVWARIHLGRNWSGVVTLKEDHALVQAGPYRWVRHPIYGGLLLALLGTAVAIGEWRGPLAILCALAGFILKLRVEEALMRRSFPAYDAYRRGTAALIPFVY